MKPRVSLLRLFLIGAAAMLVAAAVVALIAVLSGNFSETDGEILATLGVALLTGATLLAGLRLVETHTMAVVGIAIAASAVVWFTVVAVTIWNDFQGETLGKWAGTAIVTLAAELMFATNRSMIRARKLLPLFAATTGAIAVASAITISAIWRTNAGSASGKAATAFWILSVLGYFLTPLAQRFVTTPETSARLAERLLGSVGGVEVVAVPGDSRTVRIGDRAARLGDGESVVVRETANA